MDGSMWMSLLPKLGRSPWLQRAADTSCNTLDMVFFVTIRVKWYTRSLTSPLTKDAWNTAEKNIGKVAMQSPCEISEWVQLGLHTIDPELDVLLSFVTILNLAYCRLRPCDTSDMFLPNKSSTKTTACLKRRVAHFTNITMRRRCSCVVLGLSLAALTFYPRQATAPKICRVEWRFSGETDSILKEYFFWFV